MGRLTREQAALIALRLGVGVFFVFEGLDKYPWLLHPEQLTTILTRWAENAGPLSKAYLQAVVIPGSAVFARLTFLGEVAAGLALIFGVWTRAAAIVTFLLVLNIHLAHDTLLQYSFLSKGDGLPVLAGLLAIAIGGTRSSASPKKRK